MNQSYSKHERAHLEAVKSLPCSLCDKEGPSFAHHPRQNIAWLLIALCWDCHQGPNGWHGNKSLWRIRKMDEWDALGVTIKRLFAN
jgi:hypothetical protein